MHSIWKILQYVYATHTHNFLAIDSQVNGEYITACPHDDAVNILRNAGDIVVLTVKHYRAATPFLQKQRKCARTFDVRPFGAHLVLPSTSVPRDARLGQRRHLRGAAQRREVHVVGGQQPADVDGVGCGGAEREALGGHCVG